MDFKNTRLNLPKLDVVDRSKPDDQVKFRAWKTVLEAHLTALGLKEIVTKGMEIENKEKPNEEKASDEMERQARDENDNAKIEKYQSLKIEWQKYEEYMKNKLTKDTLEQRANLILLGAMGDQAITKFKSNHIGEDSPKRLWDRINDYFVQNSLMLINTVRQELQTIVMGAGETVDAVADRMKNKLSYLQAMGETVQDMEAKNILMSAIKKSKYKEKYQVMLINVAAEKEFKEMSFESVIQKFTELETYLMDDDEEKDEKEKEKI